jgi:hypothetical protein
MLAGLPTALALFVLLLAPVGFALLHWAGRPLRPHDLGLALTLGYAVLPALVLAEIALGLPWLALPLVLVCVLALRREWPALLRGGGWPGLLALPLALGALTAWVDAGDFLIGPQSAAFRVGFDVSDRAFYAMVARELLRSPPPLTENPLCAGVPFPYSYFPSLLGLLLGRHGQLPLLQVFLLHLPVLGRIWLALTTDGLLREIGGIGTRARALTVLLVSLGGDLSWAVPALNPTALERTSNLMLFHSFPAEALFYNTWMLGAPLLLGLLIVAHRLLVEGLRADVLFVALLSGALFESKVFALVPLLLGALLLALVLRRGRTLALFAALLVGAAPWAALTSRFGPSRAGSPLQILPLAPVEEMLGLLPELHGLTDGPAAPLGWAVAVLLFLAGGLGVRLVGLPRLLALARRDAFHGLLLATAAAAVSMALLLVGQPVRADGAQPLLVSHTLAWLTTGPVLAGWLARPRLRVLAVALLAIAPLAPLGYMVRKVLPAITAPDSWDRAYQVLPGGAVQASLWLSEHAGPGERLVVPLEGDPADLGGLKAVYVAALAGRPLIASRATFNLDPALAEQRRGEVRELYSTTDTGLGEALLERRDVRWVWEEDGLRLHFQSARLRPAFTAAGITLHEFR